MTDVLRLLKRSSFRGLEFPFTRRTVGFRHDNVGHLIEFRNDELIEMKGARGLVFRFEVPCFEGVTAKPWTNLFKVLLPKLFAAMRDKTPGPLVDSVHGEFRVAPGSYDESLDPAAHRDGAPVTIEFINAPLMEEVERKGEIAGLEELQSTGRRIDEDVMRIPWEQELPPEPTVEPLSAITGFIRQAEFAGNKVLNGLERYTYQLEQLNQAVEDQSDPKTYALKRRVRRQIDAAERTKRNLSDPFKPLRSITVESAVSIGELAAQVGKDVQDLIKTNSQLARTPLIQPGTVIWVKDA